MDYDLARSLKDAGFPFKECNFETCTYVGDSLDESGKNYHYPTLEELIKACGETFWQLAAQNADWYARTLTEAEVAKGSTPTEAVAMLWLSLHPPASAE